MQFLEAPAGSVIGERVLLKSFLAEPATAAFSARQLDKRKVLQEVTDCVPPPCCGDQ